jgi:hypothetical protein
MPQELGTPVQLGWALSPLTLEAKTENFLDNFTEPQ